MIIVFVILCALAFPGIVRLTQRVLELLLRVPTAVKLAWPLALGQSDQALFDGGGDGAIVRSTAPLDWGCPTEANQRVMPMLSQ